MKNNRIQMVNQCLSSFSHIYIFFFIGNCPRRSPNPTATVSAMAKPPWDKVSKMEVYLSITRISEVHTHTYIYNNNNNINNNNIIIYIHIIFY